MMEKNNLMIPIAIILSGVIIAGAVIFTNTGKAPAVAKNTNATTSSLIPVVGATDYILGNPKADVTLVEYSDTECPYCQVFHTSLHKLVDEYGKDGKFAWVYRQFPIHEKSPYESEAVLCAGDIGGQTKFWQFIDSLFNKKNFTTTGYKGIDPDALPDLAQAVDINKADFKKCLTTGKMKSRVVDEYNQAVNAGGRSGTPFWVLLTKSGEQIPIHDGAIPYADLKKLIDTVIAGN